MNAIVPNLTPVITDFIVINKKVSGKGKDTIYNFLQDLNLTGIDFSEVVTPNTYIYGNSAVLDSEGNVFHMLDGALIPGEEKNHVQSNQVPVYVKNKSKEDHTYSLYTTFDEESNSCGGELLFAEDKTVDLSKYQIYDEK
jgi:hypothetical protein